MSTTTSRIDVPIQVAVLDENGSIIGWMQAVRHMPVDLLVKKLKEFEDAKLAETRPSL